MIPHISGSLSRLITTVVIVLFVAGAFLLLVLLSTVDVAVAHPLTSSIEPSGNSYTQLVAGSDHTCGLTAAGGVWCWGDNWFGGLGNGSNVNNSAPVSVTGLSSGVTQIVATYNGACALRSNGTVVCWGHNGYGELGNGTTTSSNIPVEVTGLANVVALGDGDDHVCAVREDGTLWCWGNNKSGQLGDGTQTSRSTPVAVQGLAGSVMAVAGGRDHTCAVLTSGAVQCWGDNSRGQLGIDMGGAPRLAPVDAVVLSEPARQIAAGYQATCVVTQSDSTFCWGFTFLGVQGGYQEPLRNDTETVAIGFSTMCAVTKVGGVLCRGWINDYGQLGDGTTDRRNTIAPVIGIDSGVTAVAAGGSHACALVGGQPFCWGANGSGQVGDGRILHRALPLNVVGLADSITQVAAGGLHTCVLTAGGGVKCWGDNIRGQLGNGRDDYSATPVDVIGLASGVVAVVAGGAHTCALTQAGGVKCWGYDHSGQLGNGGNEISIDHPVDVEGLTSGVQAVDTDGYSTCALTDSGAVKCWGANPSGELGNGTTTDSAVPVDVIGLQSGVTALAVGLRHGCALLTDGQMKCWGGNYGGQLGDGTTEDRTIPVTVHDLTGTVAAMAPGGHHTCVLLTSGKGQCWGANYWGQLGDGTTTDRGAPTDITGLGTPLTAIAAGTSHTCALDETSAVQCWGNNLDGEVGDGSFVQQTVPTATIGLAGGVTALSAGGSHSCVLLTTGGVRCWGSDGDSQLGIGTLSRHYSPVPVVEALAPELYLNYTAGQPGSIFTLTGFGYPAGQPVTMKANGVALSTTITANVSGGFVLELLTDDASPGYYTVEGSSGPLQAAAADAPVTTSFFLDSSLPKRTREGMAETAVTVPEGIAVELRWLHLPQLNR